MFDRIITFALAPLLIVQGLRVRRVTPRLPAGAGPREGAAGEGPGLRLLIAGDSAAEGVGAATQQEGLSGRVVEALAADFSVSWMLSARTGRKTADVIRRLESVPASRFDVALLSTGVNDLTGGTRSREFMAQQRRLIALLKSRFGLRLVLLTSLPPVHRFPALPQPLRWCLGRRARLFNGLLEALAAEDPACEVVRPRFPLDPGYMASDGFHPGPPAYRAWALEAADIIRRRLG